MRKFMVGLVVGGLLAVAAPAMVQAQGGIADPLTLAASGVLIPFLGGSDVSLLEVASPVGENGGLHMFFFEASCARIGDSVGLPLTTNDISFVQVPNIVTTSAGLITIAQTDPSGFNLIPLESAIHTRVYVFNTTSARSRVLEPIILDAAEAPGSPHTWSPLRTAATYFAPQQTATVTTDLLFICPSRTIQNTTGAPVQAFPTTSGFPVMTPPFAASVQADMLRARIYNTSEVFLRDVRTTCACVRQASVLDVSNVYSTSDAALGTYTEIEANPVNAGSFDFAFTGYKATATVNSAVNNFVGRFSNGSRPSIQGVLSGAR